VSCKELAGGCEQVKECSMCARGCKKSCHKGVSITILAAVAFGVKVTTGGS